MKQTYPNESFDNRAHFQEMNDQKISLRDQVLDYVKGTYGTQIEYLWKDAPDYAVFRHEDNQKWYGIIMDVPRRRLGLIGDGIVDILDVKMDDPVLLDVLLHEAGYFPGWHMNHRNWISIVLDGTVAFAEICDRIDASYMATASKEEKFRLRPPKEWIVPSNPRYYDSVHMFDDTDTADWKQGRGIKAGDTVFLYVGVPVSAILYQCVVTETDIPFDYTNGDLSISSLMKIRLQKRYDPSMFPLSALRTYGVSTVRGPRGLPDSLSKALRGECPGFSKA